LKGLWSSGVVPVRHWRDLVASAAGVRGEIMGVDETPIRSTPAAPCATSRPSPGLPSRQPLPALFDVSDIDRFLDTATDSYRMTWS
jgi:hypothetical protein